MKKNKTGKKGTTIGKADIHEEIDSFIYERDRKQIETFIKGRNSEKKKQKRHKITRLHLILIISILYFFILIPIVYLIVLPRENFIPFLLFLILGYFGLSIVIYFLAEWMALNRSSKENQETS